MDGSGLLCQTMVAAGDIPGLRPARDADAAGLVALVGGVFDEYPGCVLDLDDLDADLLAPATHHAVEGNRFWVVERRGEIVACVGLGPVDHGRAELKRLYVRADQRGQGLGTALIAHVHAEAVAAGATSIRLWSDTRFLDGHRRYLAAGYRQLDLTRHLDDPSDTTEAAFERPLP